MRRSVVFFITVFIFAVLWAGRTIPENGLKLEDIRAKSIRSAGDMSRFQALETMSFSTDSRIYFLRADGRMKIQSGTPPVITQSILVSPASVLRNCYNNVTEEKPVPAATHQFQALLRSGVWTLKNLGDHLEYRGIKTYGPETHHFLIYSMDSLTAEIYLDGNNFRLKRIVLKGYDPGQGSFAISNDFGPFQETGGLSFPSGWFASQVGTRGVPYQISDIRLNPGLSPDFFDTNAVNVGETNTSLGKLQGHITSFGVRRNTLTIETNWTSGCFLASGLEEGQSLQMRFGDNVFTVLLHAAAPTSDDIGPGKGFLFPNPRDENHMIFLYTPQAQTLAENLKVLMPISAQKK